MKPAEEDRFARLVQWAKSLGGFVDPRVEIYSDPLTKFSLRVRELDPVDGTNHTFGDGQVALSCPLSATLSYLNAVIGGPVTPSCWDESGPAAFPQLFMDSVPAHVISRFFLVQQYLLGKESFWSAYIETLPQPDHVASWSLPAFWPQEDIDLLAGTNASVAIDEFQANATDEFKKARKILKELNYPGWRDYTRLLYNWSFCIFTSRSFRPSLVLPEAIECSLRQNLLQDRTLDDFSILLPIFDIANHSPTAQVKWDTESDETSVQFRTMDSYSPGQQIFNSYGMKTNSELLLGYGFILPETMELHNDYVHLRKRAVVTDLGAGEPTGSRPRDFLISLRPMSHPSSLVGRYRQRYLEGIDAGQLGDFSLFEDSMLWDLCQSVLTEAEKEVCGLEHTSSGLPAEASSDPGQEMITRREILAHIFKGDSGHDRSEIVEKVRDTLVPKLITDYTKFAENDVDVDGDVGSLSHNQQLALQYRKQYGDVLVNALKSLDPNISLVGS